MNRINMVILDSDVMFLNQLSRYLLDKTEKFTISSFSDIEKFKEYCNSSRIDLILFSEDFINNIDLNLSATKILMAEGFKKAEENYYVINKYQKAENFLKNVLTIYAEDSGNHNAILSSDKNSYFIAFYSPVGGSGKTTLAISFAKTLSENGSKVLYLNFERISSVWEIFNDGSDKSFSEILLEAKNAKENLQIKVFKNTSQDMISKIYYINPPESAVEFSEMTDTEIMKILNEIKKMSEFDYVIIDFQGEFNKRVFDILDTCKKIVFTTVPGVFAEQKVKLFIREVKMLGYEKNIMKKTTFVMNRAISEEQEFNIEGSRRTMVIKEDTRYEDINNVLSSYDYNEDIERIIMSMRD